MGWISDGLENVRNSFRGNGKTVTTHLHVRNPYRFSKYYGTHIKKYDY